MLRSLKFVWHLTAIVLFAAVFPAAAAPVLSNISPTSGYPGTQVTYTGTGFGAAQGSGSVWLGNKFAGSIVSWSDTQVVAVVAASAASGSAQVQQGGVWSNSIAFTVIKPNITGVSPTSGYPGSQVTITGTNFGATQGTGSVWLGNKLAGSIVSWSATEVVATVASTALSGSAQVQQMGVWSNSVAFTVIQPNITGISPASGYPGTHVTINGTNFGAAQGSGSVWLGNKLAGSIVSWSNTQIVATVAATALSGSAQVQQGGVWSNSVAFTVIQPTITGITPTSGVTGTEVTIDGTNFGATQGTGSVWLGSKLAGSIVSWSDTQIVATVASGSVTGNAIVQQGGVWSNSVAFTVVTPALSAIDPEEAFAGDPITLTGSNFSAAQGSGSVWLGSKLAGSIVSWSDTEIVATVDTGSVTGSAQVQQGGVWSNSIALTVLTPTITQVTPNIALVGAQVMLTGENFGEVQGSGSVWLGNQTAGSIVSWDDSVIIVTVASGASTGTAQVLQNGVWSNSRTFTVTTCDPGWTASPMGGAPDPDERVWIDDEDDEDARLEVDGDWDPSRYWSGTQSLRALTEGPHETGFVSLDPGQTPLKLNAGESFFIHVLIDPCNPTNQIAVYFDTEAGEKTFSWGDATLLEEEEGVVPDYDMGALPAPGTWATFTIDADDAGLADAEIWSIEVIHAGGVVWLDRAGKLKSATSAELVSLTSDFAPTWDDGTPIELTAVGSPLPAEYRFEVYDQNGQYTEIQAWSSDDSGTWTPAVQGPHLVLAYVRATGSPAAWEDARVLVIDVPCMPQIAPVAMDPTDRIVIDDEAAGITGTHLMWTTAQQTLGSQSITKVEGESYLELTNTSIPWESGESFVFHALIDECNPGDRLELFLTVAPEWEHPEGGGLFVFWAGTELNPNDEHHIGLGLTPGVWTRLEVPFSLLDDLGYTPEAITGVYLAISDGGRGWFDAIGTTCAPVVDSGDVAVPNDETTWFDDTPASGMTATGDAATDTTYTHFQGTTYSYRMGGHGTFEQSFTGATTPFNVATGDSLFVYAQFHPCNMPKEVVVSWHTTGGQWKSAYWGEDTLHGHGYASEIGFYRVGELPSPEWQMLSVPAAMLGVEGAAIDGVKIEAVDGLMWFQHFGSAPPRCATLAGAITAPQDEILWFDDAVPAGATESGTWNWVSSPVASGTLSHTDGLAFGAHSHSFTGASGGPTFNAGDLFSVWVQYSFCEPPREIVIGSGSRFAYWGENLSDFGSPGGTFTYMGPVPAAGGWRRLEVPASVLDVEGTQITNLLFGAYDGQVWFDHASRMPQPAAITSFTADDYINPGDSVSIDWSAVGAGTVEYQLKARNPYTGTVVTLVDWSTATSYEWTPPAQVSVYWLELYVRNLYGETREHRRLQVGSPE
ncbi:MAG: IPT/TIG domain-containing protein [Thermoanaerobaculia bacterium]